jgi:hypothetical protein
MLPDADRAWLRARGLRQAPGEAGWYVLAPSGRRVWATDAPILREPVSPCDVPDGTEGES